jgi:YVTN family beta-propeller protein
MPHGLAITPDGSQVLVAVFGTSMVAFIDTASNRVVAQVPVSSPHNIAISPDGQTAYVAAQKQGATALVILDVRNKVQIGTVPLDKVPRALNFSPDGKALYFTQAGVDAVQVLDTASNKVVGQIAVGASPHHPLVTPDGENVLVAVQGPSELAILNPATNTTRTTVPVGQMPHWIALTSDGHAAYVTNENSDDISVVDLDTHKVTATIPVGKAPRKIVIQPAPSSVKQDNPPIVIANFAFTPATLTVAPGQPIVWINNDSVQHTITSDDGKWDSGELAPGEQFTLTLDQPGTYAYHCSIHPFMQGTIIVKE